MRIAFGSDERTHLTDLIGQELRNRGHQVELVGPPAGEPLQWTDVARAVAERVSSAHSDEGVLCCWTGTGVSIAANKVPGIRAALCADAGTARGARAWLSASADPSEGENVEKLKDLDRHYRTQDIRVSVEGEKGTA